ncbi:eukaryotic peptide chain release factor subunit 1-3-like protein [Tanacetum coccineum]
MIVWIRMIILDTTLLAYVNGDHEAIWICIHLWKATRVQVKTIRALQYGKLKRLIKELKDGKGKDTCLISLIMERGDEISQVSKMLDDICGTASWPQNGFELRGAVVVDSAVRPQNGFHQAMRPKKITMVLKMKESAENDLELNGTGEGTQVDIRRKELYSEATSGGNAAADMFDASAGGADDDDLYN